VITWSALESIQIWSVRDILGGKDLNSVTDCYGGRECLQSVT